MITSQRPDRRHVLIAGAAALALAPSALHAQTARPLKIGVLNDMSSVYADYQGVGSVIGARLAVDDFSKTLGVPVEMISADHQNKPDVGAAIARRWFDSEGVDVIMDLPNSAVALAVIAVAQEKNKAAIGSGAGSSVMTGPKCSRNFVHWTYDTYALGTGLGKALTEAGGKSWFFITADYAFGKDLEANCAAAVKAAGGKVLGSVRHPLNTADFSSFVLQAQNSAPTPSASPMRAETSTIASSRRMSSVLGRSSASPASSSMSPTSPRSVSTSSTARRSAPASIGTRTRERAPSPSASRPFIPRK